MVKISKADACPDCGIQVFPLYDPNDKRLTCLPAYCTQCEVLWIDGEKTVPTKDFQAQFKNVLELSKEAGEKTKDEILQNPEIRIQKYFERVFRWAFAEGFMRAYIFIKYKMKEGRLKRMREIWDNGNIDEYKSIFVAKSLDDLREMNRLMQWTKKK